MSNQFDDTFGQQPDPVPQPPAPPWGPPGWVPPAAPRRSVARRLAGPATVLASIAVAAGAIGYAIGNHPGTTGGLNPFSYRLPSGGSFPNFNFGPSGFGSLPHSYASATNIPKAVKASEGALVDINTSIDQGADSGAATGIVLTSSGIVLTNNHVVDGATTITATDLGNSKTYTATVIGYDVGADVAVIQLQGATGLQVAHFNTSPSLGQKVYAVGNAGGIGGTPTVTSGKLTSLSTSVTANDSLSGTSEQLTHMLETDAVVISGDSGGALTGSGGKVVGIDTAGGTGGGFAIPASRALTLAAEIENGTAASSLHIGPTALLGVDIASNGSAGAYVEGILPSSPAASAGITEGSTVTSVAGRTVSSPGDLRSLMLTLHVGNRVTVTWTTSSGAKESAVVTLASGPAQ